jgi:hypothetical protein
MTHIAEDIHPFGQSHPVGQSQAKGQLASQAKLPNLPNCVELYLLTLHALFIHDLNTQMCSFPHWHQILKLVQHCPTHVPSSWHCHPIILNGLPCSSYMNAQKAGKDIY